MYFRDMYVCMYVLRPQVHVEAGGARVRARGVGRVVVPVLGAQQQPRQAAVAQGQRCA